MIFLSEYAELGISEIVMVKSDWYPGHHDFDQDKSYHDLAGKRDGKYFRAHFSWSEPHKPRPGTDRVPKGRSEYGTQEITAEEYAALLVEHGLWGAPKKDAAPVCPKCGRGMVRRTNRRTREQFWGCRNYPQCRGTLK